MAQLKAVEKLDELLKCPICLGPYTNPRILQCFHVYCQDCLIGLVVRGVGGNHTLSCPTCREVIPVPARGIVGFQAAYRINELGEILEALKLAQDVCYCSVHGGKELELYCKTCEELICFKCAYKGGEHQNHCHQDLQEVYEEMKLTLESTLVIFSTLLTAVDSIMSVTFGRGSQCVVLSNIKAELMAEQAMVKALLDLDDRGFSRTEVLPVKKRIREQIVHTSAILISNIEKLKAPFPSLCYVTGEMEIMAVEKMATLTLHVVNLMRRLCEQSIVEFLEVMAVTECGSELRCDVERKQPGQYEISYLPTFKGQLKLHVKVSDQHINGSPFVVLVRPPTRPPTEKASFTSVHPGGRRPFGVACRGRWEIVVSDEDKHCVSVYDLTSGKCRTFGSYGSDVGQFNSPHGVAVDGRGNILVADNGNHRIQMFTAEGKFITAMGSVGRRPGCFYYPSGIAFNKTNNTVYVVDKNKFGHVQTLKFNTTDHVSLPWYIPVLSFRGVFGRRGRSAIGKFLCPWGIACDSTGKVYVADTGNHRIQVFTAEMQFLHVFAVVGGGSAGPAMQSLQMFVEGGMDENYHIGVAVDHRERVYVCESGHVSVFTSKGEFVKSVGKTNGRFTNPRGLSVSSAGVIFVCDSSGVQASSKFRGRLRESAGVMFVVFVVFVFLIILYIFS